jgi:nucleotide-binding universal stress UspA family protein
VDPHDGDEAARRAESYLAETRRHLHERMGARECDVKTLVRDGPVAQTILDCAEESSCGLIVMATHSEAGIGRLVLGSVTDRILRDGQTPLLLAHPHQ